MDLISSGKKGFEMSETSRPSVWLRPEASARVRVGVVAAALDGAEHPRPHLLRDEPRVVDDVRDGRGRNARLARHVFNADHDLKDEDGKVCSVTGRPSCPTILRASGRE